MGDGLCCTDFMTESKTNDGRLLMKSAREKKRPFASYTRGIRAFCFVLLCT